MTDLDLCKIVIELEIILLGRAQPVIPPNLYSVNVNEHNSLGSPGKK